MKPYVIWPRYIFPTSFLAERSSTYSAEPHQLHLLASSTTPRMCLHWGLYFDHFFFLIVTQISVYISTSETGSPDQSITFSSLFKLSLEHLTLSAIFVLICLAIYSHWMVTFLLCKCLEGKDVTCLMHAMNIF